jgi:hypothetical protein
MLCKIIGLRMCNSEHEFEKVKCHTFHNCELIASKLNS